MSRRDDLATAYALGERARSSLSGGAERLAREAYEWADVMMRAGHETALPVAPELPTPRGDHLYWLEQSAGSQRGFTRDEAAVVARHMLAWAEGPGEGAGTTGENQ